MLHSHYGVGGRAAAARLGCNASYCFKMSKVCSDVLDGDDLVVVAKK